MRGKVILVCNLMFVFRITPAYAGKRAYFAVEVSSVRDHPRLCGEKLYDADDISNYYGSPPPMRGKAANVPVTCPTLRITPAYAGKSFRTNANNDGFEDHPRLCGEKALNGFLLTYLLGSPPPMRGKVFDCLPIR